MTKKHRKKQSVLIKAVSRKTVVYSKKISDNIAPAIVAIAFFVFRVAVLFEQQYVLGLLPIIIASQLAYSKFAEVKSLSLLDEKLFAEYLYGIKVFTAEDIETIEWKSVFVPLRKSYKLITFLSLQMKNGKKIDVPGSPYDKFDIQKPLVE